MLEKVQLPNDLLDSSPEIGSPSNAVTVTASVQAVMTAQPTASAQSITTSEPITPVQPTAVSQGLRHHDLLLERNERLEDEIWAAMSGKGTTPPPRRGQDASATTHCPGQPVPEEPMSLDQPAPEHAQPRLIEMAATFLPPGDGRTPEQRAAAARFEAAVTARARQHEEVDSSAEAATDHDADQQQIRSQNLPDHSNVSPAHERMRPTPTLLPDFQDQQHSHQSATMPVISNAPNSQNIPNDDLQASQGHAENTSLQHDGDSIFNRMVNSLIAAGTVDNTRYHQVRLATNRPIAYRLNFLCYGEWVGPENKLRPRPSRPWSVLRAIRSARNGAIVGFQDFDSPRAWEIRLLTAHSQRWYAPQGRLSDESSSERRRS